MRVLVTGASGFIGTALVAALTEAGHTPRGLGRTTGPGQEWHRADLAVPASLHGCCAGCEAVIHLGGIAHTKASAAHHIQVTVGGTEALLAEARSAGVQHLLFVSSIKAECADDDYAKSRRAAEDLIREAPGLATMIVRPALVYGPGMRGNLDRLLTLAAWPLPLPLPRDGARRSMVHRDDLVRVLMALIAAPRPGASYTVTDGKSYTLREIYDVMRVGLGRSPARQALPFWTVTQAAWLADRCPPGRARRGTRLFAPLLESCVSDDQRVWADLGMNPRYGLASAMRELRASRGLGRAL